jgi:nucleotide-binding universal stress UspA family protein
MDQAEPNQDLPERKDRPARQEKPAQRPGDASAPWRLEHPVVAGYDGSSSARNALAYAAGLARRLGRPLLVVYVANAGVYCEPLTGQVVGLPRDNDALERWLLSELDAVADRGGLDVYIRTRRGSPARELAAVASDISADALVVGAPTRFWHHLAGSVPGWLARHARCPVIVVPLLIRPIVGRAAALTPVVFCLSRGRSCSSSSSMTCLIAAWPARARRSPRSQ